jgi:hypothetical protein
MPNRVVAQVDGGFAQSEDIDPVEQGARQEMPAGAAYGLAPRLGKRPDIAHGDIRRDALRRLLSRGCGVLPIKLTHRPVEGVRITVAEIARHRAVALPCDLIRRGIVAPSVGAGDLTDHVSDRLLPRSTSPRRRRGMCRRSGRRL